MANICSNELHVYTENKDNQEYIIKFMNDNFDTDVEEISEDYLEIYFSSRWTFPEELMDKLYEGLPDKDNIDMTCLSVEWGCFYCQFHNCDKDGWTAE